VSALYELWLKGGLVFYILYRNKYMFNAVLCINFDYSYMWCCAPMKGTSFWLTLELVRTVGFCCVWGWYNLKHEKVARGQIGTSNVRLVGSVCQLVPLSISNWLVNFSSVWYFSLHFKKLNNAYLQEEVRQELHTPGRTATSCERQKVKTERSEGFSD